MSTLSSRLAGMSNQTTSTLIQRLDIAEAMPGAADLRTETYELLRLAPGQAVADVGCGGGRAVAELAERGARSIGVDASQDMVDVARRRWPGHDFLLGGA